MRLFDTTGLRRKITGLLKGTLILTTCLSMSAGLFPAGASAEPSMKRAIAAAAQRTTTNENRKEYRYR